jgi:hypothetical protein
MLYNNRIWVYTIAYNESFFVNNFLDAYKDAERIIVYDNMSTDNTVELLLQDDRVEVRQYDSGGKIRDDLYLDIKNNCWKESRGLADWVIVVDFDEIFNRVRQVDGQIMYDLDLTDAFANDWHMFKPYGYNMISIEAPLYASGHPAMYSNRGIFHSPSSKMCCFRPDKIKEINYAAGCHEAMPEGVSGDVRILINEDYKLLHYKFWNVDNYMKRMADYQTRMSKENEVYGWGWHYMIPMSEHYQMFVCGYDISKPLFDITIDDEQILNLTNVATK